MEQTGMKNQRFQLRIEKGKEKVRDNLLEGGR